MKLTRYDAEPPSPGAYRGAGVPRVSAARKAREAAIEASLARYVTLECGHMTTKEAILMYLAWSTEPGKRCYCEECGKYRAVLVREIRAEVPEQPMF